MNAPHGITAGCRRAHGFTLIELLVVMGLLSGFLLMLVQLVDSGVSMFGEGELGQALADRQSQAQRTIAAELGRLRGSPTGRDRETCDDRLVVQQLPIGLPSQPERGATLVQVLRGAVHLPVDRELALIDTMLMVRVLTEQPGLAPAEVDKRVAELRQFEPLRGLGQLLLVPWRMEGPDDALLELRAGWLLPGQQVPIGNDRLVDPFAVPVPGSAELPSIPVYRMTTPVLRELLHVEFQLWAQHTRRWHDGNTTATATPDASGMALSVWDSARGGWLVDAPSGGVFPLDRGPASAADPRDDVQPHAILVRCVVAQPAEFAPEGLLAAALEVDAQTLQLYDGDRFPGADNGGYVKVRGEWIGYTERQGDRLLGLRRGARLTKPLEHPAGTRVHVGRTVEFVVPVPHAKDDWNG
jgi:prepilin-type N-terminal cleavage/methylation domain-containing protein